MKVKEAIESRRAYRSLKPAVITKELIDDLAACASLSPSCFNKQPWKFVFIHEKEKLKELHTAISSGNEWARHGSMIIAVFSKKDDDCVIKDREYYLFDCGIATGNIIIRATALGLVAHPIAGYDPKKAAEILNIPKEYSIITLIIVGKHSERFNEDMKKHQKEAEKARPERLPLEKFAFENEFSE